MRTAMASLVVLLNLACLAAQETKGVRAPFISQEGAFSIRFPSNPRTEVQAVGGGVGEQVQQHQFFVEMPDGAYLVSYQHAPNLARATPEVISQAMDRARDSVARTFQGKVLLDQETRAGRHQGREFQVDMPDVQGLYRGRMFLANGRFYQVTAVGTKQFSTSQQTTQFLDSFRPLDK